jgi:hypothetical protein
MRREQLDQTLREHLVGDVLELHPRGFRPGSWAAMAVCGFCLVIGVIGLILGESDVIASAVLLPLLALGASLPLLGRRRYTRIRRVGGRWAITRCEMFRRTTREVDDAEVTATIEEDYYGRGNQPLFVRYFHLQLAFATRAFSGAPPAVKLLDDYRVPLDELRALCRMFTNYYLDPDLSEERIDFA